jgi:hypothetical protein
MQGKGGGLSSMTVESFVDLLYGTLFWISVLTFILIVAYILYKEISKK